MEQWAKHEEPTVEEIAKLFPKDEGFILGTSRGCEEPATITPIAQVLDSDGWIYPTHTTAYAFRVDWVSPVPFGGGPKSRTVIAIYRESGQGRDEAWVSYDYYVVKEGLSEEGAREAIDIILTRLPVWVAGGVQEY